MLTATACKLVFEIMILCGVTSFKNGDTPAGPFIIGRAEAIIHWVILKSYIVVWV